MSTLPLPVRHASQRGSILIVALLLSAIIGISLVSYLKLNQNSLNLANRSFYNVAAINLAETGIEEALWSFNRVTAGDSLEAAWGNNGWNTSDNITARRKLTDLTMHANASTAVKVYVDRYNPPSGTAPKVVAQATITLPNNAQTLTKWVEVTLRRRSKFAMGLVAKNRITFNGNTALVDSWNSLYNDDGSPRPTFVDYSEAVKKSNGSVGSTSVAVGSVAVNNADIWGYASVGTTSASDITVGNNGTIAAYGQAQGTVDTSRVATDFNTNFENEVDPNTGDWIVGAFPATIGAPNTTKTYRYAGTISTSFTVQGNVTLILTGSGNVVNITGNDTVTITADSSLNVYGSGNMSFRGNGVTNLTNQATNFQIHGTSSSPGQTIDIGGTAYFKGLVYAPNAAVTMHGNIDVMGSIVGDTITVQGNAKFHYDEALADYGGNNPWGVVRWRELVSSADRATYAAVMAGW